MSAPVGKGDWVEYIGRPQGYVNPTGVAPGAYYRVGTVYRVIEVGRQCYDGAGQVWESLRTEGQPRNAAGVLTSTPIAAFRPIDRRTTEFFRSLLTPAPELVNEGVLEEVDG